MDAATIGILGREYGAALLAKAKAQVKKLEAIDAFDRACEVEHRALRSLNDAVKSNAEGHSVG